MDAFTPVAVRFLLQSSILILAGLVFARLLTRRPLLRRAMLRATLTAVVAAPVLALVLSSSGLAFDPLSPSPTRSAIAAAPSPEPDVAVLAPATAPTAALPKVAAASATARNLAPAAGSVATSSPLPAKAPSLSVSRPAALPMAARPGMGARAVALMPAAWLAGATLLLLHLFICHMLLLRTRRKARAASDRKWGMELDRLADTLGVRIPELRVSDRVRGPILTGFFRPIILMPVETEKEQTPGRATRVLAHELAHIAGRDCAWSLAARLVCCLSFFQPLTWVLARKMEENAEEIADDAVLMVDADARAYARDLAEIAERALPGRFESPAGIGVVQFRSTLGRRVARMLHSARSGVQNASRRSLALIGIGAMLTTLAVALHSGCKPQTTTTTGSVTPGAGVVSTTRPLTSSFQATTTTLPPKPPKPKTEKERQLETALNTELPGFSFDGTPLTEVLAYFKNIFGAKVDFFVDQGITAQGDVSVTYSVSNVTLREALTGILKPKGLDFAIWHGTIYISDPAGIKYVKSGPELTATLLPTKDMTDKEKKLAEILDMNIPGMSFDGTPLREITSFFKNILGAKADFNFDPELTAGGEIVINYSGNNVTLRDALTAMLLPRGVDMTIWQGTYYVTTPEGIHRLYPDRISNARVEVAPKAEAPAADQGHAQWVAECLNRAEAVKVGWTRGDLLKVFKEEGGLSTRTNRTYVLRECQYIKVDVVFDPAEETRAAAKEASNDKIVKISKPYLAWSVGD